MFVKIFNKIVNYKIRQNIDLILIFSFTCGVYIYNLSPSVFGGDSGDFLSAIAVKGVPHPSGYPLYTILGLFFNSLPIRATIAWKVGLISTILSSLAVVFLYMIVEELTNHKSIALISSLTLAFIQPFWIYAEVTEVFALHSLFVITITYFSIRFYKTKKNKYLYTLSFLSGLSLTNNLTILLIFPAVSILVLATKPRMFLDFKLIVKLIGLFLLGLTPYIYIPIAASNNPPVNWGNAQTIENFWLLVSRQDYGWPTIIKKNPIDPTEPIKAYIIYLSTYNLIIIPIIALLGLIYFTWKKKKVLNVYLFLAFIMSGPFFLIYSKAIQKSLYKIGIIERFYIQPIIILIIFFSLGILMIINLIKKVLNKSRFKNNLIKLSLFTFLLYPVFLFFHNFEQNNFKNVYVGNNLAYDILSSLPKDAVFLVSSDSVVFNSLYLQHGLSFRKDIVIPGRNVGYHKLLDLAGIPYETGVDQEVYKSIQRGVINKELYYKSIVPLVDSGKLFYQSRMEITFDDSSKKIISIPHGLVFKLMYEDEFLLEKEEYLQQQENIWGNFHLTELSIHEKHLSENLILSDIRRHYDYALRHIANFVFERYQDTETAGEFIRRANELNPVFPGLNLPIVTRFEIDNLNIKIFRNN